MLALPHSAQWWHEPDDECPTKCDTAVCAFDEQHVQLTLAGERGRDSLNRLIPWRQALPANVPFYTHRNLAQRGTVWSQASHAGTEYDSNEARPDDESSVYLHWAVVVQDGTQAAAVGPVVSGRVGSYA